MKKYIYILSLLFSSTYAFAADANYVCNSKDALDVGLPVSMSIRTKGQEIIIQNNKNVVFQGKRTTRSSRIAVGFPDFIQNGYVLISRSMRAGEKRASLIIFDEALDSVETDYTCTKI